MPRHYERTPGERNLPATERAARANLRSLVAAYEAVRCQRCRQRDHAEHALGLALSRYDRPFIWQGIVWAWSACQDSITRARAAGIHQVHVAHEPEAGADLLPQSHRRRRGSECGRGQAFGGWSIKGRSI